MTDTQFADSSPSTMLEYLTQPVESPSDAAPEAELLPESGGIQDGQSSESPVEVASDSTEEQPEGTGTQDEAGDADSSATVESEPAAFNWDSDENPYRKDAQLLAELRQLKAEADAKAAAEKQAQEWRDLGTQLASGDLEDDDIPVVMDRLIGEISSAAQAPVVAELERFKHGFAATIAALQSVLTPEQVKAVQAETQRKHLLGKTADEIANAFQVEQSTRSQMTAMQAEYEKKIKNLTAQLAAKTIADSGESRAESSATGGTRSTEEYEDMRSWLRNGPI